MNERWVGRSERRGRGGRVGRGSYKTENAFFFQIKDVN